MLVRVSSSVLVDNSVITECILNSPAGGSGDPACVRARIEIPCTAAYCLVSSIRFLDSSKELTLLEWIKSQNQLLKNKFWNNFA